MAKIIAGVSHKGGTGRSVTLANLAYQLYRRGAGGVCLVDMDLASSTLGNILGLSDLDAGARDQPNVDNLLFDPNNNPDPGEAIIDVIQGVESLDAVGINPFSLIPGSAQQGEWDLGQNDLNEAMRCLLEALNRMADYNYIILDVRSGVSGVLKALGHKDCRGFVDMVLLHTRWTPQHIAGLKHMLESLESEDVGPFEPEQIRIIRTAFIDPQEEPESVQDFAIAQNDYIAGRLADIQWPRQGGTSRSLRVNDDSIFLGSIPMDSKLRWKETVLVEAGPEHSPAYRSFQLIASRIDEALRGSPAGTG